MSAALRDPLTAAQGRVMYHAERIFRSAGGRWCMAAKRWQLLCQHAGLSVLVSEWTTAQCVRGLLLIEWAARHERMHLFCDVRTGWRDFVPPCFEPLAVEDMAREWGGPAEQVQMMDRRRPRAPEVRAGVVWWAAEDELL